MMLKKWTKKAVGALGPHRWPNSNGKLIILAYHRVLPKADPRYDSEQPPMLVTDETLRNNLIWARDNCNIVRLEDWVSGVIDNASTSLNCAITFDDGWIDNFEYALPILQELEIPATIFCVPNKIMDGGAYWPGRIVTLAMECITHKLTKHTSLNWIYDAASANSIALPEITSSDLDKIVECCKIYDDRQIHQLINETKSRLGLKYIERREVMDKNEITKMLQTNLIDIGSHTSNHTRLFLHTPEETLKQEIVESKQLLEELLNVEINTFCYPNGYAPKNAVDLVRKHYKCGTALYRGWNDTGSDKAKLARVGLHEGIASEKYNFLACLSGLIGH